MANNTHHRLARSRGGKTNKFNCVRVNEKRHYAWHVMFGNMTGEEIAREINNLWIDPRFKVVLR